jgi:hypothetical protein
VGKGTESEQKEQVGDKEIIHLKKTESLLA